MLAITLYSPEWKPLSSRSRNSADPQIGRVLRIPAMRPGRAGIVCPFYEGPPIIEADLFHVHPDDLGRARSVPAACSSQRRVDRSAHRPALGACFRTARGHPASAARERSRPWRSGRIADCWCSPVGRNDPRRHGVLGPPDEAEARRAAGAACRLRRRRRFVGQQMRAEVLVKAFEARGSVGRIAEDAEGEPPASAGVAEIELRRPASRSAAIKRAGACSSRTSGSPPRLDRRKDRSAPRGRCSSLLAGPRAHDRVGVELGYVDVMVLQRPRASPRNKRS